MGGWIPYFDLVQLSLEGSLTVVLTRNLYTWPACHYIFKEYNIILI